MLEGSGRTLIMIQIEVATKAGQLVNGGSICWVLVLPSTVSNCLQTAAITALTYTAQMMQTNDPSPVTA